MQELYETRRKSNLLQPERFVYTNCTLIKGSWRPIAVLTAFGRGRLGDDLPVNINAIGGETRCLPWPAQTVSGG